MAILVTGANGFVGKHLIRALLENDIEVKALSTKPIESLSAHSYKLALNCDSLCEEATFLNGVNCIVHLAGLAHRKRSNAPSEDEYMQVNYHYPLKLARLAVEHGIKRFVFVSTIGVNGSSNTLPFDYRSPVIPAGDYAKSKSRAEQALTDFAKNSGLELVIIRPPLVYGRGAPGNFATLLRVAQKNLPLPLGSIHNSRSFVYVENLVDLITRCVEHPKAIGQVFLVSDDSDISTSEFLKKLITASGQKHRLLPLPIAYLKILALIIGKNSVVEQFTSSLTIDIEHTKATLDWSPPFSLDDGLKRCFDP